MEKGLAKSGLPVANVTPGFERSGTPHNFIQANGSDIEDKHHISIGLRLDFPADELDAHRVCPRQTRQQDEQEEDKAFD